MVGEIVNIAKECITTPRRMSVWSEREKRYFCADTEEGKRVIAENAASGSTPHPSISPEFKVVFVAVLSGTALFVVLCLAISMLAGREPPPLAEKVVMGTFDMAKIGFGAIVGLLGGKVTTRGG